MNRLKVVSLIFVASMIAATAVVIKRCEAVAKIADQEIQSWTWERIPAMSVKEEMLIELEAPEEISGAPYDFITLDDEYQIVLESLCADLDLDFFTMASLMFSESSFRENAKGDGGNSIGLFQINKCWWDYMFDKHGLDAHDVYDNIEIGCIIYKDLLDKYGSDEKAIQMYKCGESRGKKLWNEGKKLKSIDGILERAKLWRGEK